MNPDIKQRWLTALRSGEYQQGQGALRRRKQEGPDELCCLGVLCEIAVADQVIPEPVYTTGDACYEYANGDHHMPEPSVLPYPVRDWAGLPDTNPNVMEQDGTVASLAELNDHDYTFAQIADLIENQL